MTNETNGARLLVVLLVVGALVVAPIVVMSVWMLGFGPMMGGTWGGGMWSGGMWGDGATSGWMVVVGLAMQLLFLAALFGAGYLAYRAIAGGTQASDRALEELRIAYARGELTDDEYEHRREALERDDDSR